MDEDSPGITPFLELLRCSTASHLEPPADTALSKARRASWARLLKRIFEIDTMLCPSCGAEMAVVPVITEPDVIDHILRPIDNGAGDDPFEPRGPPEDHRAGDSAKIHGQHRQGLAPLFGPGTGASQIRLSAPRRHDVPAFLSRRLALSSIKVTAPLMAAIGPQSASRNPRLAPPRSAPPRLGGYNTLCLTWRSQYQGGRSCTAGPRLSDSFSIRGQEPRRRALFE